MKRFDVVRTEVKSVQWTSLDVHCPACAKKDVFQEVSDHGFETFAMPCICRTCGAFFSMQFLNKDYRRADYQQTLEHLRSTPDVADQNGPAVSE